MKFLLIFAGLNAANSNHNCLYCHAKSAVHITEKYPKRGADWYCNQKLSITNVELKARSHQASIANLKKKTVAEMKGYAKPPISPNIPFSNYIIDSLHLFLRVSDKLFDLLIYDLGLLERNAILSANLHFNHTRYIVHFGNYLLNVCKIRNALKPENGTFKMRSLNGDARNKIFYHSRTLFKALLDTDLDGKLKLRFKQIFLVWNNFYYLYRLIKSNRSGEPEMFFKRKADEWLRSFLNVYDLKQVTPYIHIFSFHIHELNSLHENVNYYNQEGHEKFNDLITKAYFRSTNKWDDFIFQIVKKINRIEYFSYKYGKAKKLRKKKEYEKLGVYITDSLNHQL